MLWTKPFDCRPKSGSSASTSLNGAPWNASPPHKIVIKGVSMSIYPKEYQFLIFIIEGYRFALRLENVERVIPVAELTPLPDAPASIAGAVNWRGRIIPVADIRSRFRLPGRETLLTDKIIITSTESITLGFLADDAAGVFTLKKSDIIAPGDLMPGIARIEGVVRTDDGMIIIQDINRFLSSEEADRLGAAVQKHKGGPDGR